MKVKEKLCQLKVENRQFFLAWSSLCLLVGKHLPFQTCDQKISLFFLFFFGPYEKKEKKRKLQLGLLLFSLKPNTLFLSAGDSLEKNKGLVSPLLSFFF